MRILLVEDDRKAARLLAKGLREADFLIDVAHSAEEGDSMLGETDYAVIVLDWLLPGKDGMTLCHDLRARGLTTPILMLTVLNDLNHRVSALNGGADDYLGKPFAFSELLARLSALLRRSGIARPDPLTVGDLSLDLLRHEASRAGTPIELTPKEYAMLEILAALARRRRRHEPARRPRESSAEESRSTSVGSSDPHGVGLRLPPRTGPALAGSVREGTTNVLVFTDTLPVKLPVKAKRDAAEKTIIQVADYCSWAVFKKWEQGDPRTYDKLQVRLAEPELDALRAGTVLHY